jgi:hypothetical protein
MFVLLTQQGSGISVTIAFACVLSLTELKEAFNYAVVFIRFGGSEQARSCAADLVWI